MVLTFLYSLTIVLGLVWWMMARRKELPFLVIIHSLFQYGIALLGWFFQMNSQIAYGILIFILISGMLLIWARSLNYSRELITVRLFFTMCQWVLLLAVGVYALAKSPYYVIVPSAGWEGTAHQLSIHPFLKVSGNLLLFTTFFHLILNWASPWSRKKSLLELGPILLYLVMLLYFKVIHSQAFVFPMT